jgi:hypothetical protein
VKVIRLWPPPEGWDKPCWWILVRHRLEVESPGQGVFSSCGHYA